MVSTSCVKECRSTQTATLNAGSERGTGVQRLQRSLTEQRSATAHLKISKSSPPGFTTTINRPVSTSSSTFILCLQRNMPTTVCCAGKVVLTSNTASTHELIMYLMIYNQVSHSDVKIVKVRLAGSQDSIVCLAIDLLFCLSNSIYPTLARPPIGPPTHTSECLTCFVGRSIDSARGMHTILHDDIAYGEVTMVSEGS